LLGKVIEQISQVSLAHLFQENISGKLGLKTLSYGPVTAKNSVAATEQGNRHERGMASQYGDVSRVKWRNDVIQGEVHDGNAYYAFGNIAGNAGLFSNAQDLATFTRAYLNDELLSKAGVKMMITEHTGGEEKRGLGWKIDPYPGLLSPGTFGHTGFTGTMLMVDPQQDLIIILLANAVHPRVKLGLMNPIRERVIRIISDSPIPG
jgi:CubicO group peptidase (beta-lactamase class C family)